VIGRVDPAQAATDYINQHLGEYRANPYIDYWEGWNEFVWTGGEVSRIQWFAQFEASRACQMQDLGLKAAVGGFAVGWPNTYAEFEHVLPMIEAAQRCGAIFHIHEYNRPLMYCGVASNRPDLIPGAPAISQPAGPLTLRYRLWYEGWLRPRGLADVPLLISEAGLDSVPATGDCIGIDPYPSDPSRKTWKHFGDWWVQQGIGASAELAYVNQLAWLDREMRHDSYVLGATIFLRLGRHDLHHGRRWFRGLEQLRHPQRSHPAGQLRRFTTLRSPDIGGRPASVTVLLFLGRIDQFKANDFILYYVKGGQIP